MEYVVEKEYDGKTVKDIVRRPLGISAAALKHLKFLERGILLNGERVTVRATVHEGDLLALSTEDEESGKDLTPADLPLRIAYEDECLAVPDKPADMPTHPSRDHYTDTVANALAFRYKDLGIPFVFRPINRLDRNTSGLLLIARDRICANTLSEAMRQRRIEKQYVAVLDGIPPDPEGVIDTYIRRTAESIIVRENCAEGEGGDRAVTEYRVILSENGHSIVYGGCNQGLMECIAKAAHEEGGRLIGVIPTKLEEHGRVSNYIDVNIPVDNLNDRKQLMMAQSDVFVVLPGGVGTLDEIFCVAASAVSSDIIISPFLSGMVVRKHSSRLLSAFLTSPPAVLAICE